MEKPIDLNSLTIRMIKGMEAGQVFLLNGKQSSIDPEIYVQLSDLNTQVEKKAKEAKKDKTQRELLSSLKNTRLSLVERILDNDPEYGILLAEVTSQRMLNPKRKSTPAEKALQQHRDRLFRI